MARRDEARQASETLAEIDSVFERLADWVGENPWPVMAGLGSILLVAALVGGVRWMHEHSAREASAEVAAVQQSYLSAMGASPGSFEVVEPANPEAARRIREEHAERFLAVAEEHAGTTAAIEARLEAGALLEELGEPERAREVWREAADEAPADSALRGLALERLAVALEQDGQVQAAAEAHEQAGAIEAYPGRYVARAEAARCWADAGDAARALSLYRALQDEAPPGAVPPDVMARLQRLEARAEP